MERACNERKDDNDSRDSIYTVNDLGCWRCFVVVANALVISMVIIIQ